VANATARPRPTPKRGLVTALAAVALVVVAALAALLAGGGDDGGDAIAAGDKVRVVAGEARGHDGAVVAVTGEERYRVRLADGRARTLAAGQVAPRALSAGDWVEVDGARGRVIKAGNELTVLLQSGDQRSVASGEVAFLSSARTLFVRPSCASGAADVDSAEALRAALEDGRSACVTADVGDADLTGLTPAKPVQIGTDGGSLGAVDLSGSAAITLRARMRSLLLNDSHRITIEHSVIGGTSEKRVPDQLIFIADDSDDVTIRENDIGWTTADDSGNTGYGLRVYGDTNRLRVERNYIHHVGADGIQIGMDGADAVIDRNEIAYVAPPPDSSEHADDIQVLGHGPNLRITNNYLHHNGWLEEGGPQAGGSGPYIHGGDDDSLLFENNLVRDETNFMQVGNLGTGGTRRSNLTFRRNTFADNGTQFEDGADLAWRLSGGSGNVYERNLVKASFWNEFGFGRHTEARANLAEDARLDAQGNCSDEACNPRGEPPIGYRRPSGVHW
jgi:hypothetical protein